MAITSGNRQFRFVVCTRETPFKTNWANVCTAGPIFSENSHAFTQEGIVEKKSMTHRYLLKDKKEKKRHKNQPSRKEGIVPAVDQNKP